MLVFMKARSLRTLTFFYYNRVPEGVLGLVERVGDWLYVPPHLLKFFGLFLDGEEGVGGGRLQAKGVPRRAKRLKFCNRLIDFDLVVGQQSERFGAPYIALQGFVLLPLRLYVGNSAPSGAKRGAFLMKGESSERAKK